MFILKSFFFSFSQCPPTMAQYSPLHKYKSWYVPSLQSCFASDSKRSWRHSLFADNIILLIQIINQEPHQPNTELWLMKVFSAHNIWENNWRIIQLSPVISRRYRWWNLIDARLRVVENFSFVVFGEIRRRFVDDLWGGSFGK